MLCPIRGVRAAQADGYLDQSYFEHRRHDRRGVTGKRRHSRGALGEPVVIETLHHHQSGSRKGLLHVRCSFARLPASRRSVLTRSPGRFGISDDATTMHWLPGADTGVRCHDRTVFIFGRNGSGCLISYDYG
jgi:hypothetical protein